MIIKTSYPFMKPPPSARLIRGHRLAQGLVCFPLVNEGGGLQVADLSENGNDGALEGSHLWIPGKFGYALEGQADTAVVNIGTMPELVGSSNLTLICWGKINDTTLAQKYLFSWRDGTDLWQAFYDNNDIRSRIDAGGGNTVINGPDKASFAYDEWFQYATTYDGVNHKVYFNGVLWDLVARTGGCDVNAGTTFYFPGRLEAANNGFENPFSHGMIYNRALSASEIALLYARPFGMLERRARTALMGGYEVVVGANPKGPLGHPLCGALAGPISF